MARRLNKELCELQSNPLDFCSAGPIGENIMHWNALVMGPANTPYEGGIFSIDIEFAGEYPFKPPTIKFRTKIYHPNINHDGEICKDLITNQWGPTLNTRYILTTMRNLMIEPSLETPLNPEAGALYNNDRNKYNEKALKMTKEYAQ